MMKRHILFAVIFMTTLVVAQAQTSSYVYLQASTIESVVAGGAGRSRLIATYPNGTKTEEKLENFFSLAGINFGNIRDTDQDIAAFLTARSAEGWELFSVNSGVYAGGDGGIGGGTGIFITRYLFRRPKN